MKKYLFGVFAIALALGFSAFKSKKADIRFEYQLSTFTLAQVQNPANYAPGSSVTCGSLDKACMIEVDPANTLNGGTQLDASKVTIQAQDFDANTHYGIDVVSASTGTPSWDNKN
jgi:hypothetical protein